MNDEKRSYRKQRRADLEAETRLRITVSALDLHGTVGPSQTSISAVARRAGVRRSTVYRHFPDETALFRACSAHWAAQNPRPDLEAWATIAPPNDRLGVALIELYGFFHRTEQMLDNLFRDETTVPAVRQQFSGFRGYLPIETLEIKGEPRPVPDIPYDPYKVVPQFIKEVKAAIRAEYNS